MSDKNNKPIKKAPRQAHDTYFKATFSDLDVSREVLTHRLPKGLVDLCDWNTLRLENSNVQSAVLREKTADAIFSVKLRNDSDLKIFYHIEHLSRPKRWVVLYCWNMIFEYLSKLREKEGVEKLPLVVPLILYQNPNAFPHSTDVCDLFDDAELAREYMFKPIQLYEVCQADDAEISTPDKAGVVQLFMKHIRSPDFETVFADRIAPYAKELNKKNPKGADTILRQSFVYAECKAKIQNKENFVKMVSDINEELGATMLTMAQQYLQEGEQIGVRKGEQIGIAKGKLEGKLEAKEEMALKMLRDGRLEYHFITSYTGLTHRELQRLAIEHNLTKEIKEPEEV